ncbi:MAG: alginate export family protein [Burkholderiaceae bacterium]
MLVWTAMAAGLTPGRALALEDFRLDEAQSWIERRFAQSEPDGRRRWHSANYLEFEFDERRNENLDRADNEDRRLRRLEVGIGGDYRLGSNHLLHAVLELADNRRSRADRAGLHRTELNIKQLSWQWRIAPRDALLVLGRQTVEDDREWLFDEELDGLGLAWRNGSSGLIGFVGRESLFADDLLDERNPDKPDVAYVRAYRALTGIGQASLYWVRIDERGRDDDERLNFVGGRATGRLPGRLDFWVEGALVRGDYGQRPVSGSGFDIGVTRAFKSHPWRPSITLGWAMGSGDDGGATDHAFRQTGLQGNSGRLDGVSSVDYYGHALDPELSNLAIATLGVGVRPDPDWSVDLLLHRYSQRVAAPTLRDSRLDERADGVHRRLGWGADLNFGWRTDRRLKIDASFGYFRPGAAFDATASAIRRFELTLHWRY